MKNLLLLCLLALVSLPAFAGEKESTYDRIIRTGTIRCGYIPYEPLLMKDVNTGAMSGIFYDLTENLGKKLGLKIDWVQETGYATFVTDIKDGRFDMLCSGLWNNPMQGKDIAFSKALFYMPLYPVVRADDHRFDKDPEAINNEDVRIITMEGDIAGFIRDENFPKAKLSAVQNLSDMTQLFLEISTKKADVTFTDVDYAQRYIAQNPSKVRIVKTPFPIRLYSTTWVYANNDLPLDHMISTATDELLFTGVVSKALKKYKANPASYLEVITPYGQIK